MSGGRLPGDAVASTAALDLVRGHVEAKALLRGLGDGAADPGASRRDCRPA